MNFISRPRIIPELAAQHVGLHERRLLLHAAHDHAPCGLPPIQTANAARFEDLFDRVGHVVRQVAPAIAAGAYELQRCAGIFDAPMIIPLRDVADDEVSEERQDVMRARVLYVPPDHHLGSGTACPPRDTCLAKERRQFSSRRCSRSRWSSSPASRPSGAACVDDVLVVHVHVEQLQRFAEGGAAGARGRRTGAAS